MKVGSGGGHSRFALAVKVQEYEPGMLATVEADEPDPLTVVASGLVMIHV